MRRFCSDNLVCLALALAVLGTVSPAAPAPAEAGGGVSIRAGPCLQNPTDSSMTVVWMTDEKSTGWVEYGEDERLSKRAFTSRDGLIDRY